MRKTIKTKSSSKRNRWKKGDACASNPATKKHREHVKNSLYHSTHGKSKSGLTLEALEKHNDAIEDKDEDDIMCDDGSLSEKSCVSKLSKPFSISGLTDCSNLTFHKVLRMWTNPSEQSRQVCAVLAAVTEVIRAKGGTETEVEYFGALLTALENLPTDDKTTAAAVIFLLSLTLKKVPVPVLRAKFSEASKIFGNLLQVADEDGNTSMLKNLIYCLSVLMSNQDSVVWSYSSTLQMYHQILSFADSGKPKVRKAAFAAVRSILKLNAVNAWQHPAAISVSVSNFCVQRIEQHGGDTNASTLHILNLLKQVIQYFNSESIKKVCETILKLMTLGSVVTKVTCLEVLHNLFQACPPQSNLPSSLNGKIISALYDFQPSINDVQVATAWLATIEAAYANLSILDKELCFQSLPRLYSSVMTYFLSDFRDVAKTSSNTLKTVLEKCVVPLTEFLKEPDNHKEGSTFHTIFHLVENGLKYKYHTVWDLVLPVIAAFFQQFGSICSKAMLKCVVSLCDLHSSHNFPCIPELEKTVGMAIKHMGPRIILDAVPLGLDRNDGVCEFPRSWLLPVLKEYVQKTELQYFTQYFLPLAATLREKSMQSCNANLALEGKVYDTLHQQIWALLPGFCTGAVDLVHSFKNIARILGTALSERPDLRSLVLLSLRTLVLKTQDDAGIAEVAKYAKNFLPILFNLYTQCDNIDEIILPAVLESIKTLLTIADPKLIAVFAIKAHEKLVIEGSGPSGKKKYALMDLLVIMTSYLDKNLLEKIYEYASPLIKEQDKKTQKKAYRIVEEICSGRKEGCSEFVISHLTEIRKLLSESLSSSAPSSKAPRLRCLACVIRKITPEHKDFLSAILPEVILCTKEVGSKARQAATSLLTEIGNSLIYMNDKSKEDCVTEYFHQVMAGFGGSPHMISATLHSLVALLHEYRDCLNTVLLRTLTGTSTDLLKSKDREVAKSALLFVRKLIAVLRSEDIEGHAKEIVEALFFGKDDKKTTDKHERQIVLEKLIRKVGFNTIQAVTPLKHKKFVIHIHKMTEKSRKLKKDKRLKADDENVIPGKSRPELDDILEFSESEDEFSKESTVSKPRKSKSYIIEASEGEAIDLLDPKAAKFVVGTEPKRKGKNVKNESVGFKTSADGRLIIEDGEELSGIGDIGHNVGGGIEGQGKFKLGKRKHDNDDADTDELSVTPASSYIPGGKGIHRPILKAKRKKVDTDNVVNTGKQYRAKKAKGDVKLKGKPDPFAYIPLDKRKLNKRKKAKLSGQFQGFVKAAKRGAAHARKGHIKKT